MPLILNERHRLPNLRDQAEKQLAEYQTRLMRLPPVLQVDASTEVLRRITEFSQEFEQMVLGGDTGFIIGSESRTKNEVDQYSDGGKSFVQKNRTTYERFKIEIQQTAPDFRPFVNWEQYEDPFESVKDNDEIQIYGKRGEPKDLLDVKRAIKRQALSEFRSILNTQ